MGIVNATPDSFSGDSFSGDGARGENALLHALKLVEEGADILDIGGESTRPGAHEVSLDEELARVIPLLEELAGRTRIPLSIDTTKSEVARRAIAAGASIVNDISGATFDPKMVEVVAQSSAGLVLMHLRGTPQSMKASENFGEKTDVIAEILGFWSERIGAAHAVGIADYRIALDAGFGFGKSLQENMEILKRGRELAAFGFPTLSGTSRKSSIGKILDGAGVENRLFGTAATTALAIANGAAIIRVHDVKEMRDVARVCDAICR